MFGVLPQNSSPKGMGVQYFPIVLGGEGGVDKPCLCVDLCAWPILPPPPLYTIVLDFAIIDKDFPINKLESLINSKTIILNYYNIFTLYLK